MVDNSVSVVIPTHNRRHSIGQAIDSALAQTVPVLEIIVVDDGSTDDTASEVARIIARHPQVSYVPVSPNKGANHARNLGVARAKGAWIGFLDSDDAWLPNKLEKQFAALAANPSAIASFTGIRHLMDDREEDRQAPVQCDLLLLRKSNVLGSASTGLVRRDSFLEAGEFDLSMPSCQDWDMWFRLRKLGEFAIAPEPLILYEARGMVRISKNIPKVLAGHEVMFRHALEGVSDPRARSQIAAAHHVRLAEIQMFDAGDAKAGIREAARAFRLHPSRITLRLLLVALVRSFSAAHR